MSSLLTKMLMYGRRVPFWNSFGSIAGYCLTRSASTAPTVAPVTSISALPPDCSRIGVGISILIGMSISWGTHIARQHRLEVPPRRGRVEEHRLAARRDGAGIGFRHPE